MDNALAQERREECRRKTLEFLAVRQAVANHPQTVRRRLNEGHTADFEMMEIEGALVFLVDAGFARVVHDKFGATKYYQATSTGVLAHERSEPLV